MLSYRFLLSASAIFGVTGHNAHIHSDHGMHGYADLLASSTPGTGA